MQPRQIMMPSIDMFMTRGPYCVSSIDTLERARALIDRHAIRHLPVVDGQELVGVVLDRELLALEAMPGLRPSLVRVERVMRPALSVSRNLPLDEAVDLMLEHELDCLVVRNRHGLVEGIFTAIDALDAITSVSRASRAAPSLPV